MDGFDLGGTDEVTPLVPLPFMGGGSLLRAKLPTAGSLLKKLPSEENSGNAAPSAKALVRPPQSGAAALITPKAGLVRPHNALAQNGKTNVAAPATPPSDEDENDDMPVPAARSAVITPKAGLVRPPSASIQNGKSQAAAPATPTSDDDEPADEHPAPSKPPAQPPKSLAAPATPPSDEDGEVETQAEPARPTTLASTVPTADSTQAPMDDSAGDKTSAVDVEKTDTMASDAASPAPSLLPAGSPPMPSPCPSPSPSLAENDKEAADFLTEGKKMRNHVFVTSPPGVGKTTLIRKLLDRLRKDEGEGSVDVSGFYTEEVRDRAGQRGGFDVVRVGAARPGMQPRSVLARVGKDQPKVGKYTIDVAGFEAFAIPTLALPEKNVKVVLPKNPRLYSPTSDTLPELASFLREDEDGGRVITLVSTGQELTVPASTLSTVPDGWRPSGDDNSDDDTDLRPKLFVCDEVGKMSLLSIKFPAAFLAALGSSAVMFGTIPQVARGQRDHEIVDGLKRRSDVRIVRLTRGNRDDLVDSTYKTLRESLGLGAAGSAQAVRLAREAEKKIKQAEKDSAQDSVAKKAAAEKEIEQAVKTQDRLVRKAERQAQEVDKAKSARDDRKRRAEARKMQRSLDGATMEVEEDAGKGKALAEVKADEPAAVVAEADGSTARKRRKFEVNPPARVAPAPAAPRPPMPQKFPPPARPPQRRLLSVKGPTVTLD